jgi:hypothetical protein
MKSWTASGFFAIFKRQTILTIPLPHKSTIMDAYIDTAGDLVVVLRPQATAVIACLVPPIPAKVPGKATLLP